MHCSFAVHFYVRNMSVNSTEGEVYHDNKCNINSNRSIIDREKKLKNLAHIIE